MDTAVQYVQNLDKFVAALNDVKGAHTVSWQAEDGRKFVRVFEVTKSGQRIGRYMIEKNTQKIFGIKSWAQVNPRREFGTLSTIDDFDWSGYTGVPKAGSVAEKQHVAREAEIAKSYKKRGRPRKVTP